MIEENLFNPFIIVSMKSVKGKVTLELSIYLSKFSKLNFAFCKISSSSTKTLLVKSE